MGLIKKTALSEQIARINRNGKYALRFKIEGDSLVNVRSATNDHDIVMISTTGYASRFSCGDIRASGRVSGGVYGIKVGDRKGSGGGIVGMVAMLSADEYISTISASAWPNAVDWELRKKFTTQTHRVRRSLRTTVRQRWSRRLLKNQTRRQQMKLDEEHHDSIISVRTIPDIMNYLFLLTKSGMMIRIRVSETMSTSGKSTRGTRVMELRDKQKGGSTDGDHLLLSCRLRCWTWKTTRKFLNSAKRNEGIASQSCLGGPGSETV